MELEPITRKEKIIAGQDLTPITRLEKFLKQYGGGGGGGFEYDFIIKSTDGESYTFETGTYDSIMQKLGSQPITGKFIVYAEGVARADADCIYIEYMGGQLIVYVFSGRGYTKFAINQDNTVTHIA